PFFVHPRADTQRISEFKRALADAGVEVATILPLYRWAGPDEDERQNAVRYWKRAIEIAVELGVDTMNSEFNGRHPDDFIEDGREAVDMIRGINHPNVTFLYCAPHTFHMGGGMTGIM